jgi:hypothetical protein
MATLTSPISPQNIVDRFKDFVTDTANSSIIWGTDNKPFTDMPDATFSGAIAGTTITVTGSDIGSVGSTITAASIINALTTETALYTNIRNMRALLNVTGGGGNTGSQPTAGIIFDQTQKSNLATSYRQTLDAVNNSNVLTGQTITTSNLETFFTNLQTEYASKRDVVQEIQVDICHASCHSSCHSSRGRR